VIIIEPQVDEKKRAADMMMSQPKGGGLSETPLGEVVKNV